MLRTFLLGFIASVTLASNASEPLPYTAPSIAHYTWQIACGYSASILSCEDVVPPKIVYADLSSYGALGIFNSRIPDIIFLDNRFELGHEEFNLTNPMGIAVLIHETVHYIDWHNGTLKHQSAWDSCDAENKAFNVSNRWLKAVGRPDLANENWRIHYPHCWNWPGPNRG